MRRLLRVRRVLFLCLLLVATAFVALFLSACTAMGSSANGARLARMERSPQYRQGRFFNRLPDAPMEPWRMATKWMSSSGQTVPEKTPPMERRSAADYFGLPESGLRVTWLGHSTLLVELDGRRFLLDPVWGERASPLSFAGPLRFQPPPLALDELPALDAVIISHDHYDHLDLPTIRALKDRVPRFLVPLGVGAHLQGWGVEPQRIVELDWSERHRVHDIEVVCTQARHFSGRGVSDRNRTLWSGWALLGPEHRAYYTGDSALFPELRDIGDQLGPFDVTMIEAGAYNALWRDVHFGPEQAVLAHVLLRGRVMIPVHWGTFNLALHAWTEPAERVRRAAERLGVQLAAPKVGGRVEVSSYPTTPWWPKLVWQTAPQAPVISSGLPPWLESQVRGLSSDPAPQPAPDAPPPANAR